MLQVVSIVGPTASGKTSLSIALAQQLDAEIVSLDAYQVYRGMDIGTAKPTVEERAGIPHHMIDVVDIHDGASVADFRTMADAAIADINNRGRIAVCVGGSGLYVRAMLDHLDFPQTNPEVRAKYEQLLEEVGAAELHRRLAALDPTAAALIPQGNSRRVVRALEVMEISGEAYRAELPEPQSRYESIRFGMQVDRAVLADRITRRVELMWQQGWPEEVQRLDAEGLRSTPTASRALGYADVSRFNRGETTADATKAEIARLTVKYSRRQMQWFVRDERIVWLQHDASDLVDRALAAVRN